MIRQEATRNRIFCITTAAGAHALVNGLEQIRNSNFSIQSIQEIHAASRG